MTKTIFQRAIDAWGIPFQIDQCTEECAELIVALRHSTRNDRIDMQEENDKAVCEEMADVAIMLDEMKLIFGKKEFDNAYNKKIRWLDERLKREAQ